MEIDLEQMTSSQKLYFIINKLNAMESKVDTLSEKVRGLLTKMEKQVELHEAKIMDMNMKMDQFTKGGGESTQG